jgi:4'-phosphopantetheinyl transferase
LLQAADALALLTPEERANVLRFFFVRDAKLALGSSLLKKFAITRHCGVSWSSAVVTRDKRTKPVFVMPDGSQPLLFNVSHQDGLVVLFGVYNPPGSSSSSSSSAKGTSNTAAEAPKPEDLAAAGGIGGCFAIGVDVVSPGERRSRDVEAIRQQGWPYFVEMHEAAFSPHEAARLKTLPFKDDPHRLLAYFYALWCLREGYVKMTGEALLAEWLQELDLRECIPPQERKGQGPQGDGRPAAWFRGQMVPGVDMRLMPLLDGYMVCTVVRRSAEGEGIEVRGFESLDIKEILAAAR